VTSIFFPWVVTNNLSIVNLVISCGIKHIGFNEDVRDLSGGDCDAPNSDKCVRVKSYIGHILDRIRFY
jgi:hypothetical protein